MPMMDDLLPRAVQALRAQIPAGEDVPVSVFIDPTLGDSVCEDPVIAAAVHDGRLLKGRVHIAHDDIVPDAQPYLLHAPSEGKAEQAIQRTLELALSEATSATSPAAATRVFCAWIVGEQDPALHAKRLAQAALVRKPDGRLRPLRYWDPRVMWHLPRAMGRDRWAEFCPALGHWLSLDMSHQLASLAPCELAGMASRLRADKCAGVTTETSLAQWDGLSRIGAINMALAQSPTWGLAPTPGLALTIDALLQACHQLGFSTSRDEQVFVACGMTSHLQFFEHPAVRQALQRAAATDQGVMGALGQFDDHFWQQLAQRGPLATA
ncbi:MAG: hypothetical protein RI907_594 [Pseudomonadota bacterium]